MILKILGNTLTFFFALQQEGKYEEKEIDLDELLDVDGELKKRKYLWDSLADCKQSKDKVEVSGDNYGIFIYARNMFLKGLRNVRIV